MKVNHSALVEKVAQNSRFESNDVAHMMKALQFSILDALQTQGDIVYLQGIGKFELVLRKGKMDNLTGVPRMTRDKLTVQFSPSKGLETWNTDSLA